MEELTAHLKRFRTRLRIIEGWEQLQKGLWLAIAVSVGIQLLGRFLPIESLWFWTALFPVTWLAVAVCYHLSKPYSLLKTARRVDIDLSLFERLSTCLVLPEHGGLFPPALVSAQAQDALQSARAVNIKPAYPFRFNRSSWVKTAITSGVVFVLVFLPNPMDEIIAGRKAIVEEAQKQAQEIEELQGKVEEAVELDPEQRQEIERLLTELAEKLNLNPGDLDQALADLSRVEREIESYGIPNAGLQAANLKSLLEQLNSLSGSAPDPGEELASQVDKALDELLQKQEQLDASERRTLSSSLAQMAAQASQSGNMQLARSLSELSQAIQSGDQQSMENSSQRTAQAVAQTQRSLQAQSRLSEILSSLQSSSQALAQSGRLAAQGPPFPNSQGQVSGGGGTNAPILPPGTSQRQASSPQGNKPFGGEDDLDTQGNTPRQEGNFVGDELFIPGIDTDQGSTQVRPGENAAPGLSNPSLVPYDQAYYSYLNAAMQSLSQDYIPENLTNYVQQYFLLLEPQ
ncbi:MAG: hypothetical protein A2Z16_09450 [Chloroflexi bacterium RBG_16_54_18]|nr:MAG: hypothetical protein A2Z16_09450 [Chloroflexi bacterium RBG_16_54_18]